MSWHPTERRVHFYWGGTALPWARYLSLLTFRRHHPDWSIVLWKPPTQIASYGPGSEHAVDFDGLMKLNELLDVETRVIDVESVVMRDRSLAHVTSPYVRECIRSEYLRWWLLSEDGGVWSDLDILYVRPLESAPFNAPDVEAGVHCHNGLHYCAFLFSRPNRVFREVHAAALSRPVQSVCNGDSLLTDLIGASLPPGVVNIDRNAIYAYSDDPWVWERDVELNVPSDAVGLHWHGGGVASALLHPDTYKNQSTLLTRAIDYALGGTK